MLKSYGWVAHDILVTAQGPPVLGFGSKGFGPGLDNTVLNTSSSHFFTASDATPRGGGLCQEASLS